jgi:hypothetical protein
MQGIAIFELPPSSRTWLDGGALLDERSSERLRLGERLLVVARNGST